MKTQVIRFLRALGIDLYRMRQAPSGIWRFVGDLRRYRSSGGVTNDLYPVLSDFSSEAGTARGHYFHQDLWAARLIHQRQPASHLDIGSRIDGFVAHLLTFMDVTVMDVRPLNSPVTGLSFIQGDATDLSEIEDSSIDSLSCLHAVEHFGLGRYGDSIDPEASVKAMHAMARVLAPHGRLYLSAPIGGERVLFNAHRIFDPLAIPKECGLPLVSFAAVDDAGKLVPDSQPEDFADAIYACGLYEFTKH